ncbi:ATP-binding protein [Stigmatella sp. ncwal1]|uniref:histidine kinase n=1 Tax=Stigmatella ashevillensis TaxID=2995309 RepID=A0ABT5DK92_9BACT|nr:ATP-binding protein [Stigmatella ashevillena]MDC0713548.1 ATP-binding protein [Stigmatella ashevillena]
MSTSASTNRRILVIDDNRTIHEDFRKILCPPSGDDSLNAMETELFGPDERPTPLPGFEVDAATQGEDGIRMARAAREQHRPYAVAFVDIRMPPGIDGVETTYQLWAEDNDLQVVICSAYADYSWEEMMQRLGLSQRLLILRKPFDGIEVRQLAYSLTEKWELLLRSRLRMEDLARAIEERTRQLEAVNTRLAQAQRLEALGRLSAGLAHEINNPLSFILANLGHLRSTLETEPSRLQPEEVQELRDACDESLEGAERIRRIIQNIKLFSRLDQAPRTQVDLHEVLEQALSEAQELIGPSTRLVRELEAVPMVCASETGLQQVFSGLLVNAAYALKESVREPQLRVATRLQEDGRVVVEIQDNGQGIAPEHLSRIFEPFFTTKQRVGKSSGMGLSVCYGIVTGLGGDITVESTLGQGTTFRVLLPRGLADFELSPDSRDTGH